ncbi:DUF4935 domain-containing protein [Acinetobacter calcoaceticus]|uniref:PIN-like domain-containing protein n=1 Tax=Acinetobacter calcoaceticus TaxID=471 RepID=UPI001966F8F0|nr:PIN-like domain-containing protein [Acinetobacter calcoaceticus]QSB55697.1 DUF4935 domain-containing protein [Acinetobacter calcoaceticus]
MKNLFHEHFKLSNEELKQNWQTALFVFDANVLLNLYRYSDSTRQEFLSILTKINDRSWLPYRAVEEYLNNRLSVISQQEKAYEETIERINKLKIDLENKRQHPFVSEIIMEKVDSVFNDLNQELKSNKQHHTNRIYDDQIKEEISNIFDGNVGLPFSTERLKEIITEGESRYKQKVPPGYKDIGKNIDTDIFLEKCKRYGDLIVWFQIIDKANEIKKNVILVTDDAKEDWWERFNGKILGPRPELIKEFKDLTTQNFYMYQADRFLEFAKENLGAQVSDSSLQEVRDTIETQNSLIELEKTIKFLQSRSPNLAKLGSNNVLRLRKKIALSEVEKFKNRINYEIYKNGGIAEFPTNVLTCPDCNLETMIFEDSSSTGYRCTYCKNEESDEIEVQCSMCGSMWPNSEIVSVDWTDEGHVEDLCPRCRRDPDYV